MTTEFAGVFGEGVRDTLADMLRLLGAQQILRARSVVGKIRQVPLGKRAMYRALPSGSERAANRRRSIVQERLNITGEGGVVLNALK